MKTSIIKIGNSNGVIIPSGILKGLGLTEKTEVTIQVNSEGVLIKKTPSRDGWAQAAMEMRKNNDDQLLIPDVFEDESLDEF